MGSGSPASGPHCGTDRSPPGQVESAHRRSISARNSNASPRRAGLAFHVVLVAVDGEPGDLEDVEHVVHVELGQPMRQHCASEVGVAVEVKRLAGK